MTSPLCPKTDQSAWRGLPPAVGSWATKHPASVVIVICPPSWAKRVCHRLFERHPLIGCCVLAGGGRRNELKHVGRVGADHRARVHPPGHRAERSAEDLLPGRPAELLVDEVEGRPAQRGPRHVRHGIEVPRPIGRRQQDAGGTQHAGECSSSPTGIGDVVQHVVRHDDVERAVAERQVLGVADVSPGQVDARQPGHRAGRRCHHSLGEIGEGEPQAGQERSGAGPEQACPATDLEHLPTLGPVDLIHEPVEPGHVRPRVLGVQRDAGVEVAWILVLALPQVVPVRAQPLPPGHGRGGTVLIICSAGWSAPQSSGISSSGRKPQPK